MKSRGIYAFLCATLMGGIFLAWVLIVTPAQLSKRKQVNIRGFNQIHDVAHWDLNHDMLWGYYFTNNGRVPLRLISAGMSVFGYREVDIRKEGDLWWLHMECSQTNSLDGLSARDIRFQRIAGLIFNSKYDGWDVGPLPKK